MKNAFGKTHRPQRAGLRVLVMLCVMVLLLAWLPMCVCAEEGNADTSVSAATSAVDSGGAPTGGDDGQSVAGDGGQTTTGDGGQTTTGDGGQTATGDSGQTATGDDSQPATGDGGQSSSDDGSQSAIGDGGQSSSGDGSQPATGNDSQSTTVGDFRSTTESSSRTVTQSTGSEASTGTEGVTGAGDTETEDYAVPTGSAYILEIGKSIIYQNDADKGNAIQQGVESALTYIKGLYDEGSTADRTATVVVSGGTYENGIDLSQSNSALQNLIGAILGKGENDGGKMTIRIVAEDALDDKGNITADSAGDVLVEGDITVLAATRQMELVLAGLYLSTRGLISVDGAESLEIYGTQKDDYLTIQADNVGSTVKVYSGGGNDVVEIRISGQAAASASMDAYTVTKSALSGLKDLSTDEAIQNAITIPDGTANPDAILSSTVESIKKLAQKLVADAMAVNQITPIEVDIGTGDGDDSLKLEIADSSRMETVDKEDGSLLSALNIQIGLNAFHIQADAGDGNDRVEVTGSRDPSNAFPLMEALAQKVLSSLRETVSIPESSVTVTGGKGDDVITVDNNVLLSTRGNAKVSVVGAEGFDRLHLIGRLDPSKDEAQRITSKVTSDGVELSLKALAQLTINDGVTTIDYNLLIPGAYTIIAQGMESYTDALENKRTIAVMGSTSKITSQAFTNYTVAVGSDDNGTVSFDASDYFTIPAGTDLLLANILVQGEDDQLVTIAKLIAPDFNITINSHKTQVTGEVRGRNILILAEAEDKAIVEIDTTEVINTEIAEVDAQLGIYDHRREIYIKVLEGAKLIAGEAVALNAQLWLHHDFVPGLELLEGESIFNPVTVKFGDATIYIVGTIHAGGSVQIAADVNIDEDVTNWALKVVIPGGIGIIGGQATVTVEGNADIRSGLGAADLTGKINSDPTGIAGIDLRSDSTLRVLAHAGAGVEKFSVALAGVEFTTAVIVAGNAKLLAGGDIRLLARSHGVTSVSAVGYEKNTFNVKPKSGVFIAGSFVDLTTTAAIRGNASLRAMTGDVEVNAVSRVSNITVSVAIPASEAGVAEQFSALKGLDLVKTLLRSSSKGGKGKDTTPNLTGKDSTGKLKGLFEEGGKSASDGSGSVTQLMGAAALGYLDMNTQAEINTTGTVDAAGLVKVYALGELRSQIRADGSLYKNKTISGTAQPNKAVGAALALGILENQVEARIASGTIQAKDLEVRALLGSSVSTVVAKSGHIPEDKKVTLGIAGAIGVQTVSFEYDAAILSGARITLTGNGSIRVEARGNGWFVTVGDASGKRTRKSLNLGLVQIPKKPEYTGTANSTALGAGIAVDVIDIAGWARMEDGVVFILENPLENMTVTADFDGTHHIEAAAGGAGGTSVVPVVAVSLSGMDIKAYVGTGAGLLPVTGDVTIRASGSMERELISDAKSAGVKVGLGAAVGVMVASDKVEASLLRSVTANNIIVDATSVSRVTEEVRASSRGVTPGKGSKKDTTSSATTATQEDVEKLLSENKTGTTGKETTGGVDSLVNKLIGTLTSLLGEKSGKKSGNLTGGSVSQMNEKRPSGSTTEGNIQVAAAIAVNVQSNTVLARIGDGLEISAKENIAVTARQDTDSAINANGSAVKSQEGIGAAVAVNYVKYDNQALLGNGRTSAGGDITVLATILEDAEKRLVEEILADLVEYFISQNGMEALLEKAGENGITIESLLGKHYPDYDALDDEAKATLKEKAVEEVSAMLKASLEEKPVSTSFSLAADVLEAILGEFREVFSKEDFFKDLILTGAGVTDTDLSNAISGAGLDARMTVDSLRQLLCLSLTQKYGDPSELDGIGCRISTVAISGEGASNVGVAGSAAVTYVDGTTLAQIHGRTSAADDNITAGGVVTIQGNGAQKVYTTATASEVANGQPDKKGTATTTVGVGASFAMSMVDATAKAIVGQDQSLKAQALGVLATLQNDIDTIAIAGQDPIGVQQKTEETYTGTTTDAVKNANNSTADDIAADAAVALTTLNNTVHAMVGTGCDLRLTGKNMLDEQLENSGSGLYGLVVRAYQRGQTLTNTSGFAVGKTAAVGASVALNIASSDVQAVVNGAGTVTGKLLVDALTSNEDEVNALAMVTGVNLDRYLQKLRSIVDLANMTDRPSTGGINTKVANALHGKSGGSVGASGNTSFPLSAMLNQKLGVKLPGLSTNDKAQDALDQNASGKQTQGLDDSSQNGQSLNLAAALGINITNHRSEAILNGSFQAEAAQVTAENRGNFRTTGSGATVTTTDKNVNNISAGLAVSVNNNRTHSALGGSLTTDGTLAVKATSTQNLDGEYAGLLAAQALAGSLGGVSGKASMAGAVAVVIDQAETIAETLAGTIIHPASDCKPDAYPNAITIEATDKSRLALRAGALQAGGQTVGVGASFAILYVRNVVRAAVGDSNNIAGKSLSVKATREEIKDSDYQFPFDRSDLFTVNVPNDDAANKGLININISDGKGTDKLGSNSLQFDLNTEDVLKVADLLNYGTMVNYYAEAIAGAITAGATSTGALAGAVSMIYATTDTTAEIGEGTTVTLADTLTVQGSNNTKSRQIAGALAASRKVGAGVNMVGYVNEASRSTWDEAGNETTKTITDTTSALIGSGAVIVAPMGINVQAEAKLDVLAVSIAAAVVAGGSGAALGGVMNSIAAGNVVTAQVGKGASLSAENGSITVNASNDVFLLPVSADVAGGAANVAAGGTVSAIVVENKTLAKLLDDVMATAGKNITVQAASQEKLINWLNATSISTGNSVSAIVGVIVSLSETEASLGEKAVLTANGGAIEIHAAGDVFQVVVMTNEDLSASTAAVGGVVNVGVFQRKVQALVGNGAQLIAQGAEGEDKAGCNVLVIAEGQDRAYLITISGAVNKSSGVTVSGNVTVIVAKSTILAQIGANAQVKAEDSIVVHATGNSQLFHVTPALAGSISGLGVGANTSTLVLENSIMTQVLENAKLIAYGAGTKDPGYLFYEKTDREQRRRGIILKAESNANLVMVTVCAGLSGGTGAISGVVNTLVTRNKVLAGAASGSVLSAGYECCFGTDFDFGGEDSSTVTSNGDAEVAIESDDESHIYTVAGTLAVSGGTLGVGASVVTIVTNKTVTAQADATIRATGVVTTQAKSKDILVVVVANPSVAEGEAVGAGVNTLVADNAVTASLTGDIRGNCVTVCAESKADLAMAAAFVAVSGNAAVSAGVNTLVFQNRVKAQLGGTVYSRGDVSVTAVGDVLLVNAAANASISGNAAVAPVGLVTYFDGTTEATILTGANITALGKLTLQADSAETITADVVGGAGSSSVAVNGAVVVTLSKQKTTALAQAGVSVKATEVAVDAMDTILFVTAVGMVTASGTTDVGVLASVTVLHNTVDAGFLGSTDKNSSVTSTTGSVTINARAKRDVRAYTLNVGGAGAVSVVPNVMVLVVGGKLDADSAATLKQGFKAGDFTTAGVGANEDTKDYKLDMSLLDADDTRYSDIQVKDPDFTNGYVSDDFKDENFDEKVKPTDEQKNTGEDQPNETDADGNGRGEEYTFTSESNATINGVDGILKQDTSVTPADTLRAIIGTNVTVDSAKDITLLADDWVRLEIVNVAVSASGTVAVGVPLSVAVLFSNVIAGVEEGASLEAAGDIAVKAISHSNDLAGNTTTSGETARDTYLKDQLTNLPTDVKLTDRNIRVISVAASGSGTASVSVLGAVVSLSNQTIAYMNCNVIKGKSLAVSAVSSYPNTLIATCAAGGGLVGVAVTVAVSVTHGTVCASIGGKASISGIPTGTDATKPTISVTTEANFAANVLGAALAAGGSGTGGTVAVSVNRLQAETYIGQDVTITGEPTISLYAEHHAKDTVYLLNLTAGGTASAIGSAIVVVAPGVYTYLGVSPGDKKTTLGSGKISADTITVKSLVESEAKPQLILASGGATSMAGVVLVVVNSTNAATGILRKNVEADAITIFAEMKADAQAEYDSVQVGSTVLGFSMAYVGLRGSNVALLDVSGVEEKAPTVTITAKGNATATATALTVSASSANVGLNTAVADNKFSNKAQLVGQSDKSLTQGTLTTTTGLNILATGSTTAKAHIEGLEIGVATVGGSIAIALLRNAQEASVTGGKITTGAITIRSELNTDETKKVTSEASIKVGTGSLASAVASIALAYGRSASQALLAPARLQVTGGDLVVYTTGCADTKATIDQLNISAVTGTIMAAYAYAQATFRAKVTLPENTASDKAKPDIQARLVAVEASDIQANAVAQVTPNCLDAEFDYLAIAANAAVASAKATIEAIINGKGVLSAEYVSVVAKSTSRADATIHAPKVEVSQTDIAANVAVALLKTKQKASLGGKLIYVSGSGGSYTYSTAFGDIVGAKGKTYVLSELNKDLTGHTAQARADSSDLSASVYNGRVNVMLAKSSATNEASFLGGADAYGLTVRVDGKSDAWAKPSNASNSLNLVGVGINVVIAKAEGTFRTTLDPQGRTVEIGAGGISLENNYTATAEAEGGQSQNGIGIDISAVNTKTNTAVAITGVTAVTGITGSGIVKTDGNLKLEAIGIATANADIQSQTFTVTGITVVANTVIATVGGNQSVFIGEKPATGSTTGALDISAASVSLTSKFNFKGNSEGKHSYGSDDYDAKAGVGSSGSSGKDKNGNDITITIAHTTAKANAAIASITASVAAGIVNAKVAAAGQLSVLTQGSSKAHAYVNVPTLTAAVKNVSVMTATANAKGSFTASAMLDNDEKTGSIGSVQVKADSFTRSLAETGNVGDLVDISKYNGQYNRAEANTAGSTDALFGGKGKITGDVAVLANGKATAKANVTTAAISVSLAGAAANQTVANLKASQSAKLNCTGEMSIGGRLDVKSTMEKSTANSNVSGASTSGGSVSITALSANVNTSYAYTSTGNTAAITGSNTSTNKMAVLTVAGNVIVNATSTTEAKATTKEGLTASFVSFGGLETKAYTTDTVEASVGNVTLNANDLDIDATANATATAISNAMGSASAVSAKTSRAEAGIGSNGHLNDPTDATDYGAYSKDKRVQKVRAGIGEYAIITLAQNLTIDAMNTGTAKAEITKGRSVAIVEATVTALPTVSNYETEAYVGNNSNINVGGYVTITSQDSASATSEATSSTIGFAVTVKDVFVKNRVAVDNTIIIGKAEIFATGKIDIRTVSKAIMTASTKASSDGFFSTEDTLKAFNTLRRDVKVNVTNATIESDFGDVQLLAQSGLEDNITTQASTSGDAVTTFKKSTTTTDIRSNNIVTVTGGTITDTFGTVHIWADASMNKLYSYAYADGSGLGTNPSASTFDTIVLASKLTLAGGTEITARDVELHARFTQLGIEAFAHATGKALGANVDSKNVSKVTTNATVEVKKAVLRGYDNVNITASVAPEYRTNNIYARARVYMGAVGHAKADANLERNATIKVILGSSVSGTDVIIYSANVDIRAIDFSATANRKTEHSGFLYHQGAGNTTGTATATTTVKNTNFYIGDAAGGIVIDIYEDAKGAVQVRQVGLKDEKSIWTIQKIDNNKTKLLFETITNNKAGRLTMAVTGGTYTVYDQHVIPYVHIINRTDAAIELKGLTVENTNYVNPGVTLSGGKATVTVTPMGTPAFSVTNRKSGSVHIGGHIANPQGSVSFLWEGKDSDGKSLSGNLTAVATITDTALGTDDDKTIESAPIWAKKLTISGAANVGSEMVPFFVWLMAATDNTTTSSDSTPLVVKEVTGNVWLKLTPVKLTIVDDMTKKDTGTAPVAPNLDTSTIQAQGDVTVTLNPGLRLTQLEGTKTVTMPLPGTLEFITGAFAKLTSDVTISDRTQLERYLESTDLVTGVSVYYLPNGTRLYMDKKGQILRVVEGGVDFGLSDYKYDAATKTVTLSEGVTFNITAGTLSVEEGYTYDALLAAIDGNWLLSQVKNGNTYNFVYYQPKMNGNEIVYKTDGQGNFVYDNDNKKIPEYEKISTTLTKWLEKGTLTYYYATVGGSPDSLLGSGKGKTYILTYNSSSKTLQSYILEVGDNGGTSTTNREDVTFVTDKTFYSKKDDWMDLAGYWGQSDTIKVVYRQWLRTEIHNPDGTITNVETAQQVQYAVVEPIDGYEAGSGFKPKITLSSEYDFTEFLGQNLTTISNFKKLVYNDSSDTWTVVTTDGTKVPLSVDKTDDGLFVIGVDAGANETNAVAKAVYEALSGNIWKMNQTPGGSYRLNLAHWSDKLNDENNRTYYNQQMVELKSYYYTCTYASLSEIGLVLSTNDSGGKVLGFEWPGDGTYSGSCTLSVQGALTGVSIKQVQLPKTYLTAAQQGWRLTDDLYVSQAGQAILLKGEGDDRFVATFTYGSDGSGTYQSGKIKLTNLTRKETDAAYLPGITILGYDKVKKGQQEVTLEAITGNGSNNGDIARDITGRYFKWNKTSGKWEQITSFTTKEETAISAIVDKTSGETLSNVTVKTTTLSGVIIKEIQLKLKVIADTDQGLLTSRRVNGTREYYLLKNGQWTCLEEAEAKELKTNLAETDTEVTFTAATFITLNGGTVVGSDGSVVVPNSATQTKYVKEVSGTQYALGQITGKTVTIRMNDKAGSLLNGTTDKTTIEASGDVILQTNSTGSIGKENDALRIQAGGEVKFEDLEGNEVLKTQTWLTSDANLDLGDITVDGTGKEGKTTLTATTTSGSISFGKMTVINGGNVDLDSAANIGKNKTEGDKKLDITGSSKVTMTAAGNIDLPKTQVTGGSNLTVNGKVVALDDYTGSGSTTTVTAGGSAVLNGVTQTASDSLTVTAANDLSMEGNISSTDSTLNLEAYGNLTMANGSLTGSTMTATATGDLTFGILEAQSSTLTLSADGTLHTSAADGYIYFRKGERADGKLTLTGKKQIGSAEQYLIVDTDDTLYIPAAGDYYIDSVELEGTTPYQRKRPAAKPNGSGRDEKGIQKAGELLSSNAASDTVYGELGIATNTAIAQMVISRMEREEWVSLISTDALTELIRSGTITPQELENTLIREQDSTSSTKAEIAALVAEGDTGYQALAMLLKLELTATEADGNYRLDNTALAGYLASSLDGDLVDVSQMANVLTQVISQEELAQMMEKAWANADYTSHEDTRPRDSQPRDLNIQVTQATGAAFVKNEGSITISQKTGTLTAGAIFSNRGDVTLTANNGGIQGNGDGQTDITGRVISLTATGGVGDQETLTIDQRVNQPTLVGNMTKPTGKEDATIKPLDADGKPTVDASTQTDWGLETTIRFDWIRAIYDGQATRLDVKSGGGVNVAETSGDLGLGTIHAKGEVTLTAPGSILDTRESETKENIRTTGDVNLTAGSGTIGTRDAPITTDATGTIRAEAQGNISIRDSGNLTLIADSAEGQVNASATDDLHLSNTRGDLTVGPIQAGGNATIVSKGSILEGDRYGENAQITAKSIDMTAENGSIGTEDDSFEVDTDENGGTLSAKGKKIVIAEVTGSLNLKKVQSEEDATITAPGSILDANANASDKAQQARQDADQARADAEKAEAEAFVKEELAERAEKAAEKAKKELDNAQKVLDAMTPGTPEYIRQQDRVDALKDARQQAEDASNVAKAEAQADRQKADDLAAEAANKQQIADQAKADAESSTASVTTGGDLILGAGEDIGTGKNGLSVKADGSITAEAGENIHISGQGDLNFNGIQVPGRVEITTTGGSITADGTIIADSLDVSAVGGDVGKADSPLETSVDRLDAMGDNVYIRNNKDVEIGQIGVKDAVDLEIEGDVTAGDGSKPNIIAKDLTIRADGSIGTTDKPLDTAVDGFHGQGRDIRVDNHTKDLDISNVKADSLNVTTDGNATGKDNHLRDITVRAEGYVGAPEDPFTFYAPGYVDIQGALGTWVRNLYAPTDFLTVPNAVGGNLATVVLRFDVELNGRQYSLYVLLGVTRTGELQIYGFFLWEGTATEELWTRVLVYLKEQLHVNSLGLVLMEGEEALAGPAGRIYGSTCIDLSKEEGRGLANYLPGTLAQDVEDLSNALRTLLDEEQANAPTLLENVNDLIQTFADSRDGWVT